MHIIYNFNFMNEKSDLSERKNIEQLLEENFKLKKLLQENNIDFDPAKFNNFFNDNLLLDKTSMISKLAYWHYSIIYHKLESTIEAFNILEIPASEKFDEKTVVDRIHPENRKFFLAEFAKKLNTDDYFTIDTRLLVPDGSTKYVSIKVICDKDQDGNRTALSGTISDITENHFFIDELKGKEQLFRSLFNNLTDIFIIFEIVKDVDDAIIDYIYKDVNPTFEMKMGSTKAEIIDKKLSAQPALFQQLNPIFQLSVIAGQPQQDRLYVQPLDCFFDILIYSPSENKLATIWRDVTLMVEAESSLRESEEKYRQIFAIGSDALFMFDFFSGRILDVNPTGCKLFGYSRDSLIKMVFSQLSSTPEKLNEQIQNQKNLLFDFVALKSNHLEFPIEISISYFNWSGRKVCVASIRDISERIVAQEKLIKSEQKFKQLFDYSNDAILLIKNYRIIDFNQKSISLFQLPPEELLNKTLWNLSPSKQTSGDESRNKAVEYIQNSLLGNQLQFEWIFQQPGRNNFIADIKLSPLVVGSEKVVQAIVRDISPQKEIENALVMKENLWKTSLEISSVGVWEWNLITKEVFYSAVWKNILGHEKDEFSNKIDELYNRVHEDDLSVMKNSFENYFAAKTNDFSLDIRMRCKNGTYKWIHSQGKILSYNNIGKPERFIGTHTDITKQKVLEEKLNIEIHDLSFTNNISQLGYWALDLKTMIITGHKNTFLLFGYSDTDQLSLRQIEKLIHPEDQQNFISQYLTQTTVSSLENIFRVMVNNSTRYILSKSRPIKNSKNILIGFRGTFQDITSLKQDNALLSDEKIFFSSVTNNLQCSVLIEKDNTVIYSNAKTSDIIGYPQKEILSKNISPLIFIVPEDRNPVKKITESVLQNPSLSEKTVVRIETKNNRIKWIETTISAIEVKDERFICYLMLDITDKKKYEADLFSSEKQFKSIVTLSSSAIALINPKGLIFYANESFQTLAGVTHSDLRNKSCESLFPETDFIEISKAIEALTLSLSKSYTNDFPQLGNNKSWVRVSIRPVKTAENEIEHFILNCENIDLEKKKILRLEDEMNSTKLLRDNSPFGFAHFNHKHELINYNVRFLEDLRLHNKLKVKITLADVEKLLSQPTPIPHRVYNENIPYSTEVSPSPNQFLLVEIIPVFIHNEKSILLYTIDISKSKAKIDSLTLQVDRFQGIFESAGVGMLLIDKNRNIIHHNYRFEKYLQYNYNELSFIKLDNLIDAQYLGEHISKCSQLFTGITNSFQLTLKMNAHNGEPRWININAASIKDNFGDAQHAIFVVEDITQIKNEEQEILTKERLNTLNYIANSFAHEFNNLLMGIYGNSYLLNNYLNNSPLSRYTNNLLKSTNRASELTHKLLSFSEKNNTLHILLNSEELIDEIIKTSTITPQIELRKIVNNRNELIIGDPLKLKQAFHNIIDNAVESMPNGGILTIESTVVYFEPDENDAGQQKLEKGKYLRVIISDTGSGIASNDLNKIFNPFYSTRPAGLNTGLGLPITKQTITAHNGLIKVFSAVDKGTSFNIYLPVKEANKATSTIQPDESIVLKGSTKILLIDDEDIVRMITSELLSELGYDIYSFASGKNALKFYTDNYTTINLVLLDKHMPEMDGIEVYNGLKKINQAVKVLILTGYNIDSEIEGLFSENLVGYIQKPVSIEKLSRSIAEALFN